MFKFRDANAGVFVIGSARLNNEPDGHALSSVLDDTSDVVGSGPHNAVGKTRGLEFVFELELGMLKGQLRFLYAYGRQQYKLLNTASLSSGKKVCIGLVVDRPGIVCLAGSRGNTRNNGPNRFLDCGGLHAYGLVTGLGATQVLARQFKNLMAKLNKSFQRGLAYRACGTRKCNYHSDDKHSGDSQ